MHILLSSALAIASSFPRFSVDSLDIIERTQRSAAYFFLCRRRGVAVARLARKFDVGVPTSARRSSREAAAVDFNPPFLSSAPSLPSSRSSHQPLFLSGRERRFQWKVIGNSRWRRQEPSVSVRVKLVTSADHCRARLAADSRMPTLDTGRRRERRRCIVRMQMEG